MFLPFSSFALFLIERYHSEWDNGHPGTKLNAADANHDRAYTMMQIRNKVVNGLGVSIFEKDVLEIGCGRGGICIYMAMNGAKSVTGIDLSEHALLIANDIKKEFSDKDLFNEQKVKFLHVRADEMPFVNETFDLIIADNVFEHVNDLASTLDECKRVLKPNGIIYAPNFPSIWSKFGPHLKYGAKIPWLHLLFTEKAICQAVYKRAIKYPELKLFEYYKGLINKPTTFKEIREHKDLGYITHAKLKKACIESQLTITELYATRPLIGKIIMKLFPFLKFTLIDDILSTGTRAQLKKSGE
jgi:2-polyprenyl-3-methyl-5-hydroxy-6-metoxy-1,4-benzoquinol methylase